MADQTRKKITLATQNTHKVEEVTAYLNSLSGALSITMEATTQEADIDETGLTFAENARLKALQTPPNPGTDYVLADDSGLVVPALSGRDGLTEFPGVYSNRWLSLEKRNALLELRHDSPVSTDDKNQALRILMRGQTNREAYYVCALCLVQNGQVVWEGEGRMALQILRDEETESGTGGFGYDPVMHPVIQGQVAAMSVAELSTEEKNALSHRGAALTQLMAFLKRVI